MGWADVCRKTIARTIASGLFEWSCEGSWRTEETPIVVAVQQIWLKLLLDDAGRRHMRIRRTSAERVACVRIANHNKYNKHSGAVGRSRW
jgi:hypothetical protein